MAGSGSRSWANEGWALWGDTTDWALPPTSQGGGGRLESQSMDEALAALEKRRRIAQAEREIAESKVAAAKAHHKAMSLEQSGTKLPEPVSAQRPGADSAARAALAGASQLLSTTLAAAVPPGAKHQSSPMAPGTPGSPAAAWDERQRRLRSPVPILWNIPGPPQVGPPCSVQHHCRGSQCSERSVPGTRGCPGSMYAFASRVASCIA